MRKIILYICAISTLASCNDYLEVKTYGKAIPETSEEFSALLHNRLNNLDYGGEYPLLENASELLTMETITDNFSVALTLPSGTVLSKYIGDQINQKQRRYEHLYGIIRDANIIINTMPSTASQEEQNVMGTAYALRAIAYYHLLREYSEPYSNDNQPGLPIVAYFDMEERPLRSSYGATMDFIEDDFIKALEFDVTDEIYRYTDVVVKAYQARFYFWTKQWDKAAALSEELIQRHPLVEGTAYVDMIQARNAQTGNVLIRSYLFQGNHDIAYNNAQALIKGRPLSKQFVDLFVEKEQDIRFELSFNHRRLTQKILNGKVRSAEFQLILAEAKAHMGRDQEALDAVNALRRMRIDGVSDFTLQNLPAVNLDALIQVDAQGNALSPLMHVILNERRKELFGEGDRFFELKRNGRPVFWAAHNGLKYTTEAFMYTFPLPRIDVELTPGLIQNDGYEF